MSIPRRIALVLVLLVLVACAWWAPLDKPALQQVDAGLKRALVSFATARALNGVISVAQGTEIALQPGGVGATLAPGQLLDPVNDLVEQFSQLMLIASVALGVEKILIGIGSDWTMSLALTIVSLMFSVLLISGRRVGPWLPRLLAILLMLRFQWWSWGPTWCGIVSWPKNTAPTSRPSPPRRKVQQHRTPRPAATPPAPVWSNGYGPG